MARTEIERVEPGDAALRAYLGIAIAERTRRLHLQVRTRLRVGGYSVEDVGADWCTIGPRDGFDYELKAGSAWALKQLRTVVANAHR